MPYLIMISPFLFVVAFVLVCALRQAKCPDCGAALPLFYSPLRKTARMWRAGGYLCARCGCETDTAGRKVTADTPVPPFPTRQYALVGALLLVGVGLGAAVWVGAGRAIAAPPGVAPPVAAAPPVVALPRQAPPVPPAD